MTPAYAADIFPHGLNAMGIAHTTSFILSAAPFVARGTLAQRGQAAMGLIAFTFLAFAIGRVRGAKKIPWRVIIWGTILDFAFGAIVIYSPDVLEKVQLAIQKLLDFSNAGARM